MLRAGAVVIVLVLVASEVFGFADTFNLEVFPISSTRVDDFTVNLPPSSPNLLKAEVVEDVTAAGRFSVAVPGGVQVTWEANDPVEAVTEYRVHRAVNDEDGDDFELLATTDGTSYTDHNVDEGETYVYYVTAVNEIGEGPPSDEASAEVPVDCEALEGTDDYDGAVADGDCPELTPTPTVEATAEVLDAEATPEGTATPEPTSTPVPTTTPFPTNSPTSVPTQTPVATETPIPTDTPKPTPTTEATPTTEPAQAPTTEPTVEPTQNPDP